MWVADGKHGLLAAFSQTEVENQMPANPIFLAAHMAYRMDALKPKKKNVLNDVTAAQRSWQTRVSSPLKFSIAVGLEGRWVGKTGG